MTAYVFLKFLHVLSAILAFGTTTLAFPFIGAFGAKEPAHLNFSLRLSEAIGRKAVTPLALLTLVLGVGLVLLGNWSFLEDEWILISVILFLITLLLSQLVTLPAVRKLIDHSSSPPSASGGGPPPEVMALVRNVRVAGMVSALFVATITLLMIWKPGS